MSSQTHHATRYVPTGWCIHGARPCYGSPERQIEPCPAAAHHYCPHGVDTTKLTSDGEARCAYCRKVRRHTYTP